MKLKKFNHVKSPIYQELISNTTDNGRWYTAPSGEIYASITTILGAKEKPWLEEWKESLGVEAAAKESARCADRGEAVHLMAEYYLNNISDYTKNHSPSNIKLFNKLKLRLKNIDNIRAQEIPMFSHRLKVAGRVDCVGEYDGVLSIIDFKTSSNNKTEEIIADYFKQCTAYAITYFDMFNEPIEDIVIMIAVEKGMMPLVFKDKIENWIAPLLNDINTYYNNIK